MMMGGGSLANMNLTIKQNLSMRKKKSYFRTMKNEVYRSGRGASKIGRERISEDERNEIKARVKKQIRKDRYLSFIYAVLTIAIIAGLVLYVMNTLI